MVDRQIRASREEATNAQPTQTNEKYTFSSSMLADKEHVTYRQATQQSTISTQINWAVKLFYDKFHRLMIITNYGENGWKTKYSPIEWCVIDISLAKSLNFLFLGGGLENEKDIRCENHSRLNGKFGRKWRERVFVSDLKDWIKCFIIKWRWRWVRKKCSHQNPLIYYVDGLELSSSHILHTQRAWLFYSSASTNYCWADLMDFRYSFSWEV